MKTLVDTREKIRGVTAELNTTTLVEEINFREILNEIIETQNSIEKTHAVEINATIRKESTYTANRKHCHNVLNNIISNTIRHRYAATEQPYVYIKIYSHQSGTDILLRDNLVTIDANGANSLKFPKLRSRTFQQFASDFVEVEKSVGKLRGLIWVNFEDAGGTEYRISLPIND